MTDKWLDRGTPVCYTIGCCCFCLHSHSRVMLARFARGHSAALWPPQRLRAVWRTSPWRSRTATTVHFKEKEELTFCWITPNALAKSLEGSILARLLAVPGLQLVGARMILPSDAMVDEYMEALDASDYAEDYKQAMSAFLDTELRDEGSRARGYPNRLMLILFKGEAAQQKLTAVVGGHIPRRSARGTTIRGAFGDYNLNKTTGEIEHFQFAVCPAPGNICRVLCLPYGVGGEGGWGWGYFGNSWWMGL